MVDLYYYTDSHEGWLTLFYWQSCGLTHIIIQVVMSVDLHYYADSHEA